MLANRLPTTPHTWSPRLWPGQTPSQTPCRREACGQVAIADAGVGLVAARRSRLRQLPALTTERSAQSQSQPDDSVRCIPFLTSSPAM